MEEETLKIGKDKEEDDSNHNDNNSKAKKFYAQDDELARFEDVF
jgi:hypothetical protein